MYQMFLLNSNEQFRTPTINICFYIFKFIFVYYCNNEISQNKINNLYNLPNTASLTNKLIAADGITFRYVAVKPGNKLRT